MRLPPTTLAPIAAPRRFPNVGRRLTLYPSSEIQVFRDLNPGRAALRLGQAVGVTYVSRLL